mmetsp:Transcript_38665/g.54434  ORF Transcript_38665/g.54434 Transcript_38665/m.54434 type:complete len:126 (+) Transcript_38665:82-459(+)
MGQFSHHQRYRCNCCTFWTKTTQAALLEVECQPLMGDPMLGFLKETGELVQKLDNAEQVHGNIVVMTRDAKKNNVTSWQLAKIAQASGAAALIVVNIDRFFADEVLRVEVPEGESPDAIDLPGLS